MKTKGTETKMTDDLNSKEVLIDNSDRDSNDESYNNNISRLQMRFCKYPSHHSCQRVSIEASILIH